MAKKPAPHPLATFASAALLALLGGCSVTPLQINQSNVTSGSVDAVWRLTPSGAGGLQVQVEGYRAKSTQHLDENTSVYTGEQTTLTGPLDIRNSATVQRAFVGYNHQLFADQPVRLQWFAGIGWARARWDSVPRRSRRRPTAGPSPARALREACWRPGRSRRCWRWRPQLSGA